MSGWAVSVAPERLSPWSTGWALGWGGWRGGSGGVAERTTPDVRSAPEPGEARRSGGRGRQSPGCRGAAGRAVVLHKPEVSLTVIFQDGSFKFIL